MLYDKTNCFSPLSIVIDLNRFRKQLSEMLELITIVPFTVLISIHHLERFCKAILLLLINQISNFRAIREALSLYSFTKRTKTNPG